MDNTIMETIPSRSEKPDELRITFSRTIRTHLL